MTRGRPGAPTAHPRERWREPEPMPAPVVQDLGDLAGLVGLLLEAIGTPSADDVRAAETPRPVPGALYVPGQSTDGRGVWLDVATLLRAREARARDHWQETLPAAGV